MYAKLSGLCFFAIVFLNVSDVTDSFQIQSTTVQTSRFYKAAVYEHPVVLPAKKAQSYDEAVEQMFLNLNEYKRQADIAGRQGVDIIVFPEYGLYGLPFNEPSDIENYLEYIPDPAEIRWTPCASPDRFNRTKVQTFLSCLAMNNSLYLVANYGDAQPCPAIDLNCPKNGQYQYNTNIVFNREGELIAKYHKQTLYREPHFQEPVQPEMVYFDTEFGRFGTFTCFDILFHDPAISLIEEFDVTDIVFPTAWMDALPFLSAIGYHSSFAAAYNVNFLSANVHHPLHRFQGSGIYTPDGALAYYYGRNSNDGRLLVHDVPIRSQNKKTFQKVEFTFGSTELQYLRKHEFEARIVRDTYNCVSLKSKAEQVTVCQNGLCCFLSYDRDQIIGNYAFGVFNGVHQSRGRPYYLQVCILLTCASQDNQDCGRLIFTADGYFNSFRITGNFSTPYVTPQAITSNNGSLGLLPLHYMKYDSNGLVGNSTTTPLLTTSLVGRYYDGDHGDRFTSSGAQKGAYNPLKGIYVFLLILFNFCPKLYNFDTSHFSFGFSNTGMLVDLKQTLEYYLFTSKHKSFDISDFPFHRKYRENPIRSVLLT